MYVALQCYKYLSLYSCINLYCEAGRPFFFWYVLHCVAVYIHTFSYFKLWYMFCLAIIV